LEWWYEKDGTSYGPVRSEELRSLYLSGVIDRFTRVWRQGYVEWVPLETTIAYDEIVNPRPPAQRGVVDRVLEPVINWTGRSPRTQFWTYSLAILLAGFLGNALSRIFPEPRAVVMAGVTSIVCSCAGWVLVIRRLHDLDVSGWALPFYLGVSGMIAFFSTQLESPWGLLIYAVLILIGVLYVGFAPGTKGPNSFGEDPEI